jgi:hypothetical protein
MQLKHLERWLKMNTKAAILIKTHLDISEKFKAKHQAKGYGAFTLLMILRQMPWRLSYMFMTRSRIEEIEDKPREYLSRNTSPELTNLLHDFLDRIGGGDLKLRVRELNQRGQEYSEGARSHLRSREIPLNGPRHE